MGKKLTSANSMKKGSYIIIDDVACVVSDVTTSKPGKHGSTKARISASGLFDNRKRVIVMPTSDSVEVPIVDKRTAQVLSVSANTANVMDSETYETFDLTISEEFAGQVNDGGHILYWVVLGEKVIKQVKD
ncbi:translation initiation factor IF-5A [Candidatus Woesearchaeota archaeon]|nr:translation initiation factor IF-5A [Candidatus Woesearchaeota archaeon]